MSELATLHVLVPQEPVTARQVMRPAAPPGTRLWLVGTDVTFGGPSGFDADAGRVVAFGIWDDLDALDRALADDAAGSWPTPVTEGWHAVLRPYRSHGAVNWVDGPLFPTLGAAPDAAEGAVLTMTTTAFSDDADKVAALVEALATVQADVGSAPGVLASVVSLGRRKDDGRTFTVWRDLAAMQEWAYRSEPHAPMIARQRAESLMPRSSFTRFAIERAWGTWKGSDPLALWHDRPR